MLRYFFLISFNKALLPTFTANIAGCLLIGIILKKIQSSELKLLLATGFLGGLTTFSTFGFETFELLRDGMFSKAIMYSIGSLVLGLLAVVLGVKLGNI